MDIAQILTKNDIKEGLIRVSGENLAFFHGGKCRSKEYEMQILLPDEKHYDSRITFNTSSPRFLKDIRVPLRAYYQKVGAKIGDKLTIRRNADDSFIIEHSSTVA